MDILDKLDNILFEANNIPKGIKSWVADYIITRHEGNVKLAKEMKKNIEDEIKSLGLKKKEVFGIFGDPDDPKQKDKVLKKAKDFQGY